jgi:hypothetical protein
MQKELEGFCRGVDALFARAIKQEVDFLLGEFHSWGFDPIVSCVLSSPARSGWISHCKNGKICEEPAKKFGVIGPETSWRSAMKNPTGDEMRKNAENCGELASEAKDTPGRKRYQRMQAAWKSLANTQDWLDGKQKRSDGSKAED